MLFECYFIASAMSYILVDSLRSKSNSFQMQHHLYESLGLKSENVSTNRPNRYKVSKVSLHTFSELIRSLEKACRRVLAVHELPPISNYKFCY